MHSYTRGVPNGYRVRCHRIGLGLPSHSGCSYAMNVGLDLSHSNHKKAKKTSIEFSKAIITRCALLSVFGNPKRSNGDLGWKACIRLYTQLMP